MSATIPMIAMMAIAAAGVVADRAIRGYLKPQPLPQIIFSAPAAPSFPVVVAAKIKAAPPLACVASVTTLLEITSKVGCGHLEVDVPTRTIKGACNKN